MRSVSPPPSFFRRTSIAVLGWIAFAASLSLETGCLHKIIVPAAPAGLSCLANPPDIFSGDPITLSAVPSNLDPTRPLLYSWSGPGLRFSNSRAATTLLSTTNLGPGTYTATLHATQEGARSQSTGCSVQFAIRSFEPPTVGCSANPSTVVPGESSTITATGISPQNRPLKYSYSATAGSISGSTANATLSTIGAAPRPITVTCNVVDDNGQSASQMTTVNLAVPAAPPPPEPVVAGLEETTTAAHSVIRESIRHVPPNGTAFHPSPEGAPRTSAPELGVLSHDAPPVMTLNVPVTVDAAISRATTPTAPLPVITSQNAPAIGLIGSAPVNNTIPIADQMIVTLRSADPAAFKIDPIGQSDTEGREVSPGGHAEWHWTVTPLKASANPNDKKMLILHSVFVTHSADGAAIPSDQGSSSIPIAIVVAPWYVRSSSFVTTTVQQHWIGILGWFAPSSFAAALALWKAKKRNP